MTVNTKLVVTLSAFLMGGTGIALTFMPQEVSAWFGCESPASALPFQLLGALYFGFAMTNWTARANLIGGIYGRPIAIGNLCHFMVAALALVKGVSYGLNFGMLLMMVYAVLAIMFGLIFFTHPIKDGE